ncbi:MAG: NAD-dependent epimerase/dehydratase family protein [Chloroflexi bacterium]|nr:MAG: NAD-dependent epimerase/dehydratase family protein [Chloroflexota bacterium]
MKVFITGGTGFIGRHLIRRMAQTDHELRCLARPSSDIAHFEELGVEIVYGDVTDKPSIVAAMQGCDWVIDLANIYEFWLPDPSLFAKVNIEGTQNLMEAALETDVMKVVHVSTALVYGKPKDTPFTEESKPGPVQFSEYARTKQKGEEFAWKLHEENDLPLVSIYPVGVLGLGDTKATSQVVRNLVQRRMPATAYNNSTVVLVHVKDVVEGIVRAIEKDGNIGERYILGKEQITLKDYYKMVCEIADVPLPFLALPGWMAMSTAHMLTALSRITKRPPWLGMNVDQMRSFKTGYLCDGSKAEKELGITYTPIRVGLEEEVMAIKQALMLQQQ